MSLSSSSTFSSRRSEGAGFLARVAALCLLLWAVDHWVVGSTPVLSFLYANRPQSGTVDYHTWVEKQMAGVDYLGRSPEEKVLFVGSSSVANGIDVARIQPALSRLEPHTRAVNFGINSLCAYELPLLSKYLLRTHVRAVVYLYNTFSFTDELIPQAPRTHWNTWAFLKMAGVTRSVRDRNDVLDGALGELFATVRYRELIRETFSRALTGTLRPPRDDYDFPADEAQPTRRSRVPEPPLPDSDPGRRMRTSSDTMADTLSYRGLRQFLAQAEQKGIRVVVMPAPEPEFASVSSVRRGINVERIDAHVSEICRTYGVTMIPRDAFADLEAEDEYFRDTVHLHWRGRERFSDLLASRYLPTILGRSPGARTVAGAID